MVLKTDRGARLGDDNVNVQTLADAIATLSQVQFTQALTALAGGGITGATKLQYGFNEITVCATGADSTILPLAIPGTWLLVVNSGAAATTVFGATAPGAAAADTINGTAGATGLSQANGARALYFCIVKGKWLTLRATS